MPDKATIIVQPRYDTRSIWLHWITALLVVGLWCAGQTIDWFGRGDPRVIARSLHIAFGALLVLILCYRVWWRATRGWKLPPADSGAIQAAAKSVHWGLYVLLVASVALGLANVWVRGDNLFNLFTVPAFDPGNKPLRAQVGDLHKYAVNILFGLAGLHAAAGLWHHFIRRDGVLRRMWPAKS